MGINRHSITTIMTLALLSGVGSAEGSLSGAIGAFRSDSLSRVLELTPSRIDNQWLEIYRLYMRAEAFGGLGDSLSAAERAVSALRMIRAAGGGHNLESKLVGIASRFGGPELGLLYAQEEILEDLDPGVVISFASSRIAAGDTLGAQDMLLLACGNSPSLEDLAPLHQDLEHLDLSQQTLECIASAAIRAEDQDLARKIAARMASGRDASIIRADILASSGMRRKALSIYTSLAGDGICPPETRKKLLRRTASLHYRMRHLGEAARDYRRYGELFPGDRHAERYTDMSARISVSSGRWQEALETWGRIAADGPRTRAGREALLGMAVVLERLGRGEEACSILCDNLENVSGTLRAAYLYWIVRTSGDSEVAGDHHLLLDSESSYTFYARAIEEGDGFLIVGDGHGKDLVRGLESTTRVVPAVDSVQPDTLPALGAFRYFASAGFHEEAADCARDHIGISGCSRALYREARNAGLEGLCLEMAASCEGLFIEDRLEYLFPFAYGEEIDSAVSRYSLPAAMVLAVIREESRFDLAAVSHAGALGLMQLMPSTGGWIGPKIGRRNVSQADLFDPSFNILAGCWYLRFLLDRADGSVVAALAAYNAGHGRMRRWKQRFSPHLDPLAAVEMIGPEETRRYVRRVLDVMSTYSRLAPDSFH